MEHPNIIRMVDSVIDGDGITFPRRLRCGPLKGELVLGDICQSRSIEVLRNPRYAGAFSYGRRKQRYSPDGRRVVVKVPREEWAALVPSMHEGYVTWHEYEENQERLWQNALAVGADHRRYPPREEPALLQGIVVCGRCGAGMTVRYRVIDGSGVVG